MLVSKFELFVDNRHDRGVVQVHTVDTQGRDLDPFAFTVDSEFVMAFAALISLDQVETIATLTDQRADLQNQLAMLIAQVASLREQVNVLKPWNPRWIDPQKFVARFTAQQTQKVYKSSDPILIGGRQLLESYIDSNYQVVLDDEQVIGLTDYMVTVGILTAEERIEILRDSSSLERYEPTVA